MNIIHNAQYQLRESTKPLAYRWGITLHIGHPLVFEYNCSLWSITPSTNTYNSSLSTSDLQGVSCTNLAGYMINEQKLLLHTSGKLNLHDAHNHFEALHTLQKTTGQHTLCSHSFVAKVRPTRGWGDSSEPLAPLIGPPLCCTILFLVKDTHQNSAKLVQARTVCSLAPLPHCGNDPRRPRLIDKQPAALVAASQAAIVCCNVDAPLSFPVFPTRSGANAPCSAWGINQPPSMRQRCTEPSF